MSVSASACGIARISISSAGVMPFWQMAEKPPRKLTPTAFAALSRVWATFTKSAEDLQALPAAIAIGVTEIRLLTIGTLYSRLISSPVFTRSRA